MARLPTRDDLGGLPSARTGRPIASYDTSAIGKGLANAGAAIESSAVTIGKLAGTGGGSRGARVSQAEQFEAQRKFLEFQSAQEQAYEESKGTVDPGAFGFREQAQNNYKNAAKEFFKSIPDALKPEYDMKLFATEDNLLSKSRAFETTERTRYYGDEIDKGLDSVRIRINNNAAPYEDLKKQGLALIDAADMPDIWKAERRSGWDADAAESKWQFRFKSNPQEAISQIKSPQGGNVGRAYQRLISKGWTPAQAAGVVGNLTAESGKSLNTQARNPGDGSDGSDSIGVAQWNGARARALKAFAAARGTDWHDFDTQIDFVDHELRTSERSAGENLARATNAEEAAAAFTGYERPAGWSAGNAKGSHNWSGRRDAALRIAGENPASEDPDIENIPYDRRQQLANWGEAEIASDINASAAAERQRQAAEKVQYDQHKGSLELALETGELNSELSILNDDVLTDAHKADLIKSFRSKMEGELATGEAVRMFNDGSLNVDPYDTKGKKTVDNVWGALTKAADEETDIGPVAESLVRQTGTVPQQVVNSIRKGASSTNPDDIMNAAQTAQRIATVDPAALARRDGGGEAQTLADDFSHYVNNLNMSPEEAAEKIATLNDPEKKRDRKALEPAAKEFAKELEGEDLGAVFDESWAPFSDPDIGFTEGQALGIQAEYQAIAQEQFYKANGNVDVAKNRAKEEMKRLYGVTNLTGRSVVMKHPPERYWPKDTSSEGAMFGIGADPLGYAKTQLYREIVERDADFDPYSVQFVTTPATEQMIKRGEMPGYSVFYTDKDGIVQTFPGQLWRPDFKPAQRAIQNRQEQRVEDAVEADEFQRERVIPGQDRERSLDNFLDGNPMTGEPKPLVGGGGGY